MEFKIFTESKADIKFLQDYIAEKFGVIVTAEEHFDVLGSWSGYKQGGTLKNAIQLNYDAGKKIILIVDADADVKQRREELTSDFEAYNVPIELFLFPDNQQNGNLENLLCNIAIKEDILHCFENYETCVVAYEAPVIKSKVFAYLDALLPAVNKKNDKNDLIQEAKRNYRNRAHWDLHHDYLQPLHNFLSPLFSEA